MSKIRMFLYAALGVICLVLWNTWQKDHPPVAAQPTQAASSSANEPAALSNVPTDTTIAATVLATSHKATASVLPTNRLIKVHTDTLDVVIDTLGGNVISAKLLKYPLSLKDAHIPIQLLSDDPEKLYIATSGLISAQGPDTSADHQAQYSAAAKNYALDVDQKELTVKLIWQDNNGLQVTKVFTFTRGQYDIKVNFDIVNQSNKEWQGKFFAKLERKSLGEDKGGMFSFKTFTGGTISSPEKPYEKLSYSSLAKENIARTAQGGWLAFQQQYFLSAWIPEQNKAYDYFSQSEPNQQIYTLGLANSVKVLPNAQTNITTKLYVGPEIADNLKALAPNLALTVDYGWLYFLSVWLFWLLQQAHRLVGNWGWAIIIVTILIKAAFYKFSEKAFRSMAKMKDLGPRMKMLKERYGDDKQKLHQATMEMYKKEKINPMGGCLPMLVQIPFFIAFYYVLISAVELRQAPFIFWIHDISAQDPYYILPVLMGLSMFVSQKLNPQSPTQDPMQAKMMMFLPVVFTVFFLSFPAGLVLYWLVNNCLQALQQWYIMKNSSKITKKTKK